MAAARIADDPDRPAEAAPPDSGRAGALVFPGLLLLAVILGAALRLQRLGEQILMDDEWHGLAVLQDHGWLHLATHFGVADHCIPLTLWHKLLAAVVGMDEWCARLLPLLCGLALVVLVPWWLRRHVGDLTAGALALGLAIAPLPVFFSRFARPYGVALLLCWLAVLALHEHCRSPRRRSAVTFALAAALAVWFLPPFAPFLLAAWLATLRSATWAPGLGAGAVAAVLLGPALVTDLGALTGKAGRDAVGRGTWEGLVEQFAGLGSPTSGGMWCVVAVWGCALLARPAPLLLRLLGAAAAAQLVAIALTGAHAVSHAGAYARYCLPVLPLLLLGVARASAGFGHWLHHRTGIPPVLPVVALPLALLPLGPWGRAYWDPNQWTAHAAWWSGQGAGAAAEAALLPAGVSGIYGMLASLGPRRLTIVETPFPYQFSCNPYTMLQRRHRQLVVGGLAGELVPETLMGWRGGAGLREPRWLASITGLEGLRRRGVQYVFVHHDLAREFPHVDFLTPVAAAPILAFLREAVGPPVFADAWLSVFELGR